MRGWMKIANILSKYILWNIVMYIFGQSLSLIKARGQSKWNQHIMCCPKLCVDKQRKETPAWLSRFSPKVSIVSHFVCNSVLKNSIITNLKKHIRSDDASIRDSSKKEIHSKLIEGLFDCWWLIWLLGPVCLRLSPLNCSTHVTSVVRSVQ